MNAKMTKTVIFGLIAVIAIAGRVIPQTPDADALAAIAIAKAIAANETPTVNSIIRKMTYQEASAKAIRENKPLIVFVGQQGRDIPGVIVTAQPDLNGYPSPSIVVGVPSKGQLLWKATLGSRASDGEILYTIGSLATGKAVKAEPAPFDPFSSANQRQTSDARRESGGKASWSSAPVRFGEHYCPKCRTPQTWISGAGPYRGTHMHRCPECGQQWYH